MMKINDICNCSKTMAYSARNFTYPPPHSQVIVTQPNMPSKHVINVGVDNLPGGYHAYQMRKWSTKLCGCCEDCSSCFLAMFFPPCFSCYLASLMGELCCLPICVPGSLMALRVKLRAGNNIEGSICEDCLSITFCPTCAMCQIKRELDNIEKGMLMVSSNRSENRTSSDDQSK